MTPSPLQPPLGQAAQAVRAPVEPERRRRVFSVRLLGDDMRHAPRRWKTSPEFPGLADQPPAGAPMDHPLFPLLWREAP